MSKQPEHFDEIPTRPPRPLRRLRRPQFIWTWVLRKVFLGNPIILALLQLFFVLRGEIKASIICGAFLGSLLIVKCIFSLIEWKYTQNVDFFRQKKVIVLTRKIVAPMIAAIFTVVLYKVFLDRFFVVYVSDIVLLIMVTVACILLSILSHWLHISD